MPDNATTAAAGATTVTEEQLLKSIQALEGKTAEPAAAATQTVVVEPLKKSTSESIAEGASEELKKAIEVSKPLKEIVALLGVHNDTALQTLQKSLQAAADRDNATVKVLERLAKSLEDNTAALKEYAKVPATTPASRAAEVQASEVLNKSTKTGKEGEPNPGQVRKQVLSGLEILAKSCQPGTTDASKWIRTISKFESTGKISDEDLLAATNAYKDQGKK